jgi:orotate phosphoribosyltransferase
MIVDDVITAGTAIRESIDIIHQAGAVPAGVIVAVDRQERGKGSLSAIQEVEQEFALPVYAIINLNDLLGYVKQEQSLQQHVSAMEQYQAQYGV